MLQFLRSLVQSSQPAEKAWRGGEPRAKSPEEANNEWAPHIAHWQKLMRAKNFRQVFSTTPSRGQLGWLESPAFWETYWDAFQKHCANNAAFAQNESMRKAMALAVVHNAGLSGNMALFMAAKKGGPMAQATLLECVREYTQPLYHPAVLDWVRQQDPKTQRQVGSRQRYLWSRLPWEKTPQHCMFGPAGRQSKMEPVLDVLADGFSRWPLTPAEKTTALAHLFLNCPGAWHKPSAPGGPISTRVQERLGSGLLQGVDAPAIALVCGVGPSTVAAAKGIRALARQLREKPGQPVVPTGLPALGILESMYTIATPRELYDAVIACHLHRADPPTPVDSCALPDLDPT